MSTQLLIEKFIYSCSHDLRAPVTSIQGLVRIAEYYTHHDETQKCLQMIDTCAHKMIKMIGTLQEYMMNQHRPLSDEEFNARHLVEHLHGEFKAQLVSREIEWIAEIEPGLNIKTDRYSLFQALKQLVSNSISYHDPAKPERKIWIRIGRMSDQGTMIHITDNGKGISDDQQERIFDLFHKATESSIGLGMGLFLTQSLIQKMGGRIACRSEAGKGTHMEVVLP